MIYDIESDDLLSVYDTDLDDVSHWSYATELGLDSLSVYRIKPNEPFQIYDMESEELYSIYDMDLDESLLEICTQW